MFLLTSKRKDFITDHIINLLSYNIDYLTENSEKSFFKKIFVENFNENIRIYCDEIKINLKKPISFYSLHSNLFSILSNIFFKFDQFIFYPLIKKIENKNISIKLTSYPLNYTK